MTVKRMDNVGIVVEDIDAAIEFFTELGLELEGRAPIEGEARVVPLSEAKNFRLEKGAPDLRGWNVFGSDGERVGVVSQLLVDPTALKVRPSIGVRYRLHPATGRMNRI